MNEKTIAKLREIAERLDGEDRHELLDITDAEEILLRGQQEIAPLKAAREDTQKKMFDLFTATIERMSANIKELEQSNKKLLGMEAELENHQPKLNLASDKLFEKAVDHFIGSTGFDRFGRVTEENNTMHFLEPDDWKQILTTYNDKVSELYSDVDVTFGGTEVSDRQKEVLYAVLSKYTFIVDLKAEKIRENDVRHAMGHVFQDVLRAYGSDPAAYEDVKVPIKKYVDDPSLPWPERYARLEAHHVKETTWLIEEINRLREEKK